MYPCCKDDCLQRSANQNGLKSGSDGTKDFSPLYLLSCAHSVCETCLVKTVEKNVAFIKCDKCNFSTTITEDLISNVVEKRMNGVVEFTGFGRNCTVIKKLSEDSSEQFPIDSYAFGEAFNVGLIQAAKAVEIIDIDLDGAPEPGPSDKSKVRGAYLNIDSGDDHLVLEMPEKLRLRANPEYISVIRRATEAYIEHGQSMKSARDEKIRLDVEVAKLKEEAQENFHVLHSILQIREKEILKEISVRAEKRKAELIKLEEKMANHRRSLKRLVLKCGHTNTDVEKAKLQEDLLDASSHACIFQAKTTKNSELFIEYDDQLKKNVRSYGTLPEAPSNFEHVFEVKPLPPFIMQSAKPLPIELSDSSKVDYDMKEKGRSDEKPDTVHRVREEIVKVTQIYSPVKFFARLCSVDQTAAELSREIDAYCGSVFKHAPAIGTIPKGAYCFAFSTQFNTWCRARFETSYIADNSKNQKSRNVFAASINVSKNHVCQVYLIDYGAMEEVPMPNVREKDDGFFDFKRFPLQVMRCSLYNIKPPNSGEDWPVDAIEKFREYVHSQQLLMYIKEIVQDIHYCDLSRYNVKDVTSGQSSLIEILVFNNNAMFRCNERLFHALSAKRIKTFPMQPALQVGTSISVLVVHIESPDLFYVNVSRHQNCAVEILEKLKEYEELPFESYRLYHPQKRLPCVARFKNDRKFYRAIITDVHRPSTVTVQFVDFGNQEVVPINELRLIKNEYLEFPQQAIPCCLADVAPQGQIKWSSNAIEKFKSLVTEELAVGGQIISMVVHGIDDSNKARVVLHRYTGSGKSINLNAALVDEKFARSVGVLSLSDEVRMQLQEDPNLETGNASIHVNDVLKNVGEKQVTGYRVLREIVEKKAEAQCSKRDSLIKVIVSNVVSPSEFCIQVAEDDVLHYFKALERKLCKEMCDENGYFHKNTERYADAPFEENEICGFKMVSDCGKEVIWRRASVIEKVKLEDPRIKDELRFSYKVSVIDYGGTRIVRRIDMAKLPRTCIFTKDGPYAVRCHIVGVQPAGSPTWTSTALERFTSWLEKHPNHLHILVKTKLPPDNMQTDSVGVSLVFKEDVIPGPLDPMKTLYYTCKNMLVGYGVALLARRSRSDPPVSDDEHDLNNCETQDVAPIEVPFERKEEDSVLAALKQSYYHPPSDRRYESTQYYQDPVTPRSAKFKAVVTEVDAELNIYFRIMFDEGDQPVNVVNQTITNALKEKSTLAPFVGSFETKRACTAYFNYDKTWNRAEIVGLVRDQIGKTSLLSVYFVDYGNFEHVYAEQLSAEVFNLEIPKLALKAQLYNCKPYEAETVPVLQQELTTLLVDKVCLFSWENHQVPMKVSIEVPDIGDLQSHLLNKDLIVNATDSFESVPNEIRNITDLIIHTNYEGNGLVFRRDVYYPVVITEVMPCGYIYLQANHIENVTDLEEERINKQYSDFLDTIERMRSEVNQFSALFRFKRGDPCCVQFTDQEWYRAMILKVIEPEREAEVVYVDYGNTEIVDVNRIKCLPPKYVDAPPVNAFVCHLSNVVPTTNNGIWLKDHTEKLREVLLPMEYLVAKFKTDTQPYEIELFEANVNDKRNPTRKALQSLVDDGILQEIQDNIVL